MDTCTLDLDDAVITYDVHGPDPAPGDRPLLTIGQPMDATGFRALAAQLPECRIVAYDPPGIGRSTRRDGRTDHDPHVQAADLHALVDAIGGPVDLLASCGGAVTALALVAAYPGDVRVLVAHEPPCSTSSRTRRPPGGRGGRCRRSTARRATAPGWPPSSR